MCCLLPTGQNRHEYLIVNLYSIFHFLYGLSFEEIHFLAAIVIFFLNMMNGLSIDLMSHADIMLPFGAQEKMVSKR